MSMSAIKLIVSDLHVAGGEIMLQESSDDRG
jgi:hypothetical protein